MQSRWNGSRAFSRSPCIYFSVSIYLSVSAYLSVYLSIYIYLSIYLSIYPSICIYSYVYLSIYLLARFRSKERRPWDAITQSRWNDSRVFSRSPSNFISKIL